MLGDFLKRSLSARVHEPLIKDKVSFIPQVLSGGLSMEAYVALHQADELQGIISEIKVEKHVVCQSFCSGKVFSGAW